MLGLDFDKIPVFGPIKKWLSGNGFDYGGLVAILCVVLLYFVFSKSATLFASTLSFFIALTPIWLPLIIFALFFNKWMDYVGSLFYLKQGRSTLRIKLPPEVLKSPEAMEFVLAQVHASQSPDNLFQTYLQGKRPLPMSLEIASVGGDVRFYMNGPTKKVRNAFEAQMYAQYPGVEIIEEPVDYTAEFSAEDDSYEIFSVHMGKKKEEELPIKTYIDYGLDKLPKEEEKVDPITPMLEAMASIQGHERIFCQFICIPYREEKFLHGQLRFGESEKWFKQSEQAVEQIIKERSGVRDDDEEGGMSPLTPGDRDKIAAIERNKDKYAYYVGIRWLYISKGPFNADVVSPMIRSFSQYDAITRNGIGVKWRTDFDYKDYIPGKMKKKLTALKKQELTEYKMRVFAPKNNAGPKIFTVEELATMFHLPGKVALTPALGRITSARSQAPSNLPIGELPT